MVGLACDTSCSTNALMAVVVCCGLLSSSREHERAEERARRGTAGLLLSSSQTEHEREARKADEASSQLAPQLHGRRGRWSLPSREAWRGASVVALS